MSNNIFKISLFLFVIFFSGCVKDEFPKIEHEPLSSDLEHFTFDSISFPYAGQAKRNVIIQYSHIYESVPDHIKEQITGVQTINLGVFSLSNNELKLYDYWLGASDCVSISFLNRSNEPIKFHQYCFKVN